MLKEYDMKRNSVKINRKASQWSHNAVWNRKYMEPKLGYTLKQLWEESETSIGRKTSPSYNIKDNDTRRAVEAIANLPPATSPESPLLRALGTPAQRDVPPQNATLAQRAMEEWERTLWGNKAVAILEQMQEGRPALIQKDGGEMLIAMVLDRRSLKLRLWSRTCSLPPRDDHSAFRKAKPSSSSTNVPNSSRGRPTSYRKSDKQH